MNLPEATLISMFNMLRDILLFFAVFRALVEWHELPCAHLFLAMNDRYLSFFVEPYFKMMVDVLL